MFFLKNFLSTCRSGRKYARPTPAAMVSIPASHALRTARRVTGLWSSTARKSTSSSMSTCIRCRISLM